MPENNSQLPRYLLDRYQSVWTVTFTALFSLVALFVASPFCANMWLGAGSMPLYLLSAAFMASSLAVIAIDRSLMARAARRRSMDVAGYVAWLIAEVPVLALLYVCFTSLACALGAIPPVEDWPSLFLGACLFALLCIGVPALVSAKLLGVVEENNVVRLTNFSNVVSDSPEKPYEDKRITLFDSSGALKISINEDNLYFIESDDNYIKVWYTVSTGEVRQYMLRCPLKTVEDSFSGSVLVRCHRKFIVNINKVCILRSEKEGYKITLGLDGVDSIPISKTYEQNVLSRFNSRQ